MAASGKAESPRPVWNVGSPATESEAAAAGGSLGFLGHAPRGEDVVVIKNALPADFASRVGQALRNAPEQAWKVLDSSKKSQDKLKHAQARQDVQSVAPKLQAMRFSSLEKVKVAGVEVEQVAAHVGRVLALRTHERLILNFARYEVGDFLDSHTDIPSGNAAYERVRAWVWHLSSPTWDASTRGGCFVDEVDGTRYPPVYNSIVHFGVPRWHSVEPVTRDPKARRAGEGGEPRYSAYGWIATPRVNDLARVDELQQLAGAAPVAVVGWFGAELQRQPACEYAHALAALSTERVGVDRVRGEYVSSSIATTEAVAHALGLPSEPCIAVVRWKLGPRMDVLPLPAAGGTAAIGVFIDEHRGAEGVPRLDCDDHSTLIDMYATQDVKVYIFLPGHDHAAYAPTLAELQSQHRARLRLFLCDPELTRPLLDEAGVAFAATPTVLAHDPHGLAEGKPRWWRLEEGRGLPLSAGVLAAFVAKIDGEVASAIDGRHRRAPHSSQAKMPERM